MFLNRFVSFDPYGATRRVLLPSNVQYSKIRRNRGVGGGSIYRFRKIIAILNLENSHSKTPKKLHRFTKKISISRFIKLIAIFLQSGYFFYETMKRPPKIVNPL